MGTYIDPDVFQEKIILFLHYITHVCVRMDDQANISIDTYENTWKSYIAS